MTVRMAAASATERAIGPTVSWCSEIGMTGKGRHGEAVERGWGAYSPPSLDVRPTVGLMPTILLKLLGHTIDPSVSVPSVTAANPIEAATAEPEDEPHCTTTAPVE